jgi:hypothetical protein
VKHAIFFGLSGIVALAGCRAIVGIEDLEPQAADAGNKQNPKDGGGGGSEAGPGPGPGPAFDINSCVNSSSGCRPCCKQNIGALKTVFEQGAGAQCLCMQSTCKDKCIDGICASPPASGPPKADCAKCTDDFLGNSQGNSCESSCGDDQGCHLGIQCLQNCTKNGQ